MLYLFKQLYQLLILRVIPSGVCVPHAFLRTLYKFGFLLTKALVIHNHDQFHTDSPHSIKWNTFTLIRPNKHKTTFYVTYENNARAGCKIVMNNYQLIPFFCQKICLLPCMILYKKCQLWTCSVSFSSKGQPDIQERISSATKKGLKIVLIQTFILSDSLCGMKASPGDLSACKVIYPHHSLGFQGDKAHPLSKHSLVTGI